MEEPVISYSIKDILARVEGKLDAALIAVATKAEHADLLALDERVRQLEQAAETKAAFSKWLTEWKRWLIPTLLSAALTASTIVTLLH